MYGKQVVKRELPIGGCGWQHRRGNKKEGNFSNKFIMLAPKQGKNLFHRVGPGEGASRRHALQLQ